MTIKPIAAELLIATGCAHCPVVLEALTTLLKNGRIAKLTITNIQQSPERAEELGVRSVPWLQLGPFILAGMYTLAELTEWVEHAGSVEGMSRYIDEQLKQGNLYEIEHLIKSQPEIMTALIPLMENEKTNMKTRFGIDALIETLAMELDLSPLIPELGKLSINERQPLRADATHYLSLTRHKAAIPFLEARLKDESEDVQEIAQDSLKQYSQGEFHG
jgi:thioredoxin-like negative regulator of GroEL